MQFFLTAIVGLEGASLATSGDITSAEFQHTVDVDTGLWGWGNDGLARILLGIAPADPVAQVKFMFFRGSAMFDSWEDARDDYLFKPLVTRYTDKQVSIEEHVPFGMVQPHWEATRLGFNLRSATIFFHWQEH